MFPYSCRFLKGNVRAAAVLAGLIVASCGPEFSSPEEVQTSNPSVTYKYRSDQELVQANASAATFCNRYQSVPRTANFATDPDGSRLVIFECVPPSGAPPLQYNANFPHNYRTDPELLHLSRNAQTYCRNSGSQQVISNIVTNSDGSKTITFRCSS